MADRGMSSDSRELLKTATEALSVSDITLYSSTFERPSPMPVDAASEATQQTRRHTKYTILDPNPEDENKRDLVIMVTLGVRLIGPPEENANDDSDVSEDEDSDPPVYFVIEAKFLVEYTMTRELPEEAIKAFARHNSVHNVWPFWRQHVFDIVQRGRLPHVDVPLFSVRKDISE